MSTINYDHNDAGVPQIGEYKECLEHTVHCSCPNITLTLNLTLTPTLTVDLAHTLRRADREAPGKGCVYCFEQRAPLLGEIGA